MGFVGNLAKGIFGGSNSQGGQAAGGFLGMLDPGGILKSGPNTQVPTKDIGSYGASPYSSQFSSPIFNSISGLQSSLDSMTAPSPVTAGSSDFTPDAYKAKDMTSVDLPQYDAMRTRLNAQYSQGQSQAQDALDRQFAAAGGGPGNGAQLKQTENLAASTAKQKDQDELAIEGQEAQERSGLQQQESQKEFQSGEAQKGLGFQAKEADLSRQSASDQFNQQMLQNWNQFKFGAGSQLAGLIASTSGKVADLNTAWDTASAEAANNQFNAELASYQAAHSGGLLGGGGLLGTGLFGGD